MGILKGSSYDGWDKITPCLKLVKIVLETWTLVCKYKLICSFRKYTLQLKDPVDFTDVSIAFVKVRILAKKIFLQQ